MLIRRELPRDVRAVRDVHASAFAQPGEAGPPAEVGLVEALRADEGWIPELALVAETGAGDVVGHVVCTRGWVGTTAALGLGPLGVRADDQGRGIGQALMHAVLGAADALGEPLVALLGHTGYYPRFGFRPAAELGITPPVEEWAPHFQVRALTTCPTSLRGEFAYAEPFMAL